MELHRIGFTRMDSDSSESALPPGSYREASNIILAESGRSGGLSKSTCPGTVVRTNSSLPSGVNTPIGYCEDPENSRIVYFIHNSLGSHCIFQYSFTTSTHTKIMQSVYLAFSTSYPITGAAVLKDTLVFTDALNGLRSLNITQAIANYYTTGSDALNRQISLHKLPPHARPTATFGTDLGEANNISGDSWMFSCRYVFFDNETSLLGPYSEQKLATAFPDKSDTANNYITITQSVHADLQPVIKKVQFLYKKNDEAEVYLFKEVAGTGASSYSTTFYNADPSRLIPDEELTSVNMVPLTSKNLTIFKERAISTLDQYDYAETGNFLFSLSTTTVSATAGPHHLGDSTYTYAIQFFDEYMRPMYLLKPTKINIPGSYASSNTSADPASPKNVTWTIGG